MRPSRRVRLPGSGRRGRSSPGPQGAHGSAAAWLRSGDGAGEGRCRADMRGLGAGDSHSARRSKGWRARSDCPMERQGSSIASALPYAGTAARAPRALSRLDGSSDARVAESFGSAGRGDRVTLQHCPGILGDARRRSAPDESRSPLWRPSFWDEYAGQAAQSSRSDATFNNVPFQIYRPKP